MISISAIIPVYNSEKYLSECIESLLAQTLLSCEFIFINDGSTDDSKKILESYNKTDSRIVLIHQDNKGVSTARNQGILSAKGRYLTFVDADDFVLHDYLQVLYDSITSNNNEIVGSNFMSQINGNWILKKIPLPNDRIFSKPEIQNQIIPIYLREDLLNPCWGKIFDRAFLVSNQILFPKDVTNGEDALFCINAFSKASKVTFIDYYGYYYREVEGSASRNILNKNYLQIAIDNFIFDHKKYADLKLDEKSISHLKLQRFVDNIYILIHIYLVPNPKVSIKKRIESVKRIIKQPIVKQAFKDFNIESNEIKSIYKRSMFRCINRQFLTGILALIFYSNLRNYNFFQNKNK
jgi:glycosyltransferase involved in cell wall biosynthesis